MTLVFRGAAVAFAVLSLPLTPAALAQEYPTKPIRIIVGPGPDVLSRLFGQRFTDVGWEPAAENSSEWFADYIKREVAKWAKVVKETGAKVD